RGAANCAPQCPHLRVRPAPRSCRWGCWLCSSARPACEIADARADVHATALADARQNRHDRVANGGAGWARGARDGAAMGYSWGVGVDRGRAEDAPAVHAVADVRE